MEVTAIKFIEFLGFFFLPSFQQKNATTKQKLCAEITENRKKETKLKESIALPSL